MAFAFYSRHFAMMASEDEWDEKVQVSSQYDPDRTEGREMEGRKKGRVYKVLHILADTTSMLSHVHSA
jgi:hypothetical protein